MIIYVKGIIYDSEITPIRIFLTQSEKDCYTGLPDKVYSSIHHPTNMDTDEVKKMGVDSTRDVEKYLNTKVER